MHLILASASPRRAELLRAAGFEVEVRPADVDERTRPGETPAQYVQRLASEKAAVVWEGIHRPAKAGLCKEADIVVLGADTAVVVDGEILGKPRDAGDAGRMLRQLAGRAHQVLTGVAIRSGAGEVKHVASTAVTFAPMSESEIAWYISTGEGQDKAGGYGIQGLAARFIKQIEGSYTNVVGLPVEAVSDILSTYQSQKSL